MNIDNLQSEEVEKKWGKEIIIVNNDKYCGKILCLKKDKKFSMHYHMIKDETWYVSSGELILKWIDTSSAIQNEKKIKKLDSIFFLLLIFVGGQMPYDVFGPRMCRRLRSGNERKTFQFHK